MSTTTTVAVGLSGGVDSALAAALLVESGYKVIGLTMKIWKGAYKIQEGLKHACFGPGEEEDIAACEAISARLGIDYKVIDLSEEYEARVLEYFRAEYNAGRTPNPCIICNRELKFGFLVDKAHEAGLEFDYFATGHYVRKESRNGVTFLKTAADTSKDQSYFLYGLESPRLERILFPLGELTKDEVRRRALALNLEVAEKPESQDFVAGGDYTPLFENSQPEPGDIVDTKGKVLGQHRGLPFYTIGQRRGLGISIGPEPLYVLGVDVKKNRVIVGPNNGLFSSGLISRDFRFQDSTMAGSHIVGLGKIRQNHKPAPCTLFAAEAGGTETRELPSVKDSLNESCGASLDCGVQVQFELAQRAVAPGQSFVLYSEDGLVLGGGVIDEAIADNHEAY
ncbi:MAG: tRNA 2-thiouridine(34) synthase MnmA [Spirochaetia bacterium]|jgi:tRNA-specific 2-thiouridylase|nr:tRNA 2-thiouridine(34) synthase MnmA [Spirochaetia bacterium]